MKTWSNLQPELCLSERFGVPLADAFCIRHRHYTSYTLIMINMTFTLSCKKFHRGRTDSKGKRRTEIYFKFQNGREHYRWYTGISKFQQRPKKRRHGSQLYIHGSVLQRLALYLVSLISPKSCWYSGWEWGLLELLTLSVTSLQKVYLLQKVQCRTDYHP